MCRAVGIGTASRKKMTGCRGIIGPIPQPLVIRYSDVSDDSNINKKSVNSLSAAFSGFFSFFSGIYLFLHPLFRMPGQLPGEIPPSSDQAMCLGCPLREHGPPFSGLPSATQQERSGIPVCLPPAEDGVRSSFRRHSCVFPAAFSASEAPFFPLRIFPDLFFSPADISPGCLLYLV